MNAIARLQYWRILTVYILIAGVVGWQWHFVTTGIESNPYLNLVIIAVFAFGSVRLLTSLVQLRNEGVAFNAIKEVWDDVQSDREGGEARLARFERAFAPGRVYRRPKLLGHIFELTLEELLRSRQMRISLSTMQNLMHAVDGRIALDRSLVSYLAGLCVFLGLIGTFIGLMEMVGSVGGIIGNVAADSSGGNPTETVQRLISSLQAPLNGMATGFSASLFGLFSSLVLGLVAKFVSQATGAMRDEFEAWLAGISEIEGKQTDDESAPAAAGHSGFAAGQLGGVAVSLVAGMRRSQASLDVVVNAVRQLGDWQAQQVTLLGQAVDQLQNFAAQEAKIRQALGRTDAIWSQMGKMREDLHRLESVVSSRVVDGFEAVSARLSADTASTLAAVQQVASAQTDAAARMEAASEGVAAAVAAVGEAVQRTGGSVAAVGEAVEGLRDRTGKDAGHIAQILAEITALAREGANRAQDAETAARTRIEEMERVAVRTAETSAALLALIETARQQPDAMAAALRPVLAEGFSELSHTLSENAASLSAVVGALAVQQKDLAATLDASGPARALGTELREVARVIEGSMVSGFGDLARSVEGIFLSYADMSRRNAEDAAAMTAVPVDAELAGQGRPGDETIALPVLQEIARRRHPMLGVAG